MLHVISSSPSYPPPAPSLWADHCSHPRVLSAQTQTVIIAPFRKRDYAHT